MNTGNEVVKRQQGRRVLLLIAGIPLSIMLAATLLWWAVAEGQFDIVGAMGTANHGELIVPPKSLSQRTFSDDGACLLYTSPSPRDVEESRMPSSA